MIGVGQAAISTALSLGGRFGIISVSDWSVGFHQREMVKRGVERHCAGDRPTGMTPAETESAPDALERMVAVARALKEQDGADVLITACAGMAKHRKALEGQSRMPCHRPCLCSCFNRTRKGLAAPPPPVRILS
ncbi:aspartate/glutamate racemase family protein [uncultured Cohaesibacter sp.]|uniref:aspartate/glutamate racemase family protein n=1 Tax=uncultured Cohaesibacter sp. TaxID=1002546 RepID=UPI0037481663